MTLTERGPELDIVAKQVSRTDRLDLRKSLKKPFRLRSFSNTGRTDENDAGSFAESHSIRDSMGEWRRYVVDFGVTEEGVDK